MIAESQVDVERPLRTLEDRSKTKVTWTERRLNGKSEWPDRLNEWFVLLATIENYFDLLLIRGEEATLVTEFMPLR